MIDGQYAAGFVDGEGSIYLSKSYHPYVEVGNSYLPILELFQERWGGAISHPKKARTDVKERHRWYLGSPATIRPFLDDILPFLHEKRRQAALMLDYLASYTYTTRQGCRQGLSIDERALREGYYLALKEMKK